METHKVAGWAGIGTFVSLLLAQFMFGGFPDVGEASASEITEYFGDAPKIAYALSAIAFTLALVFASSLYTLLRPTIGDEDWARTLLLAAGIAIPIMAMVATTGESALMLGGDQIREESVHALLSFSNAGYIWSTLAMAVFLLAAWRCAPAAGLPRWLSYVALVGSVVAFVGVVIGSTDPGAGDENVFGILGFAGFILWGLWLLLAGISLVRGRTAQAPPPTTV